MAICLVCARYRHTVLADDRLHARVLQFSDRRRPSTVQCLDGADRGSSLSCMENDNDTRLAKDSSLEPEGGNQSPSCPEMRNHRTKR